MSVIHWQFCPPVQCAYVFCKRITERSETMISVAWNFSVMWQDHHTGWHAGPNGRDTTPRVQLSIPAPLRHVQAGTYNSGQWRESTAHRAGFLCQSLSEMSLQMRCPFKGLAYPCPAHRGTWGRLPSKQLNHLRHQQAATGTWGWCLGHTTCP